MYYLLSAFTGLLIASMIAINGELTVAVGVYTSTAIIHLVGLALTGGIVTLRRAPLFAKGRPPWPYFLGGVIGSLTTVFNNAAFGRISVSAILALGLLGQSLTSLLIDHFGWFSMPRRAFKPGKLVGLLFVLCGAGVMLRGGLAGAWLPIVVSLLSGATVVLSRSVNAALTDRSDTWTSTFFNYVTGLIASLPLLWLLGRGEPLFLGGSLPTAPWVYTGGLVGVCVVYLCNVIVRRISSFYMTLLVFVGQVFAGAALDTLLGGALSMKSIYGGALVLVGLCVNLYLDRDPKERLAA